MERNQWILVKFDFQTHIFRLRGRKVSWRTEGKVGGPDSIQITPTPHRTVVRMRKRRTDMDTPEVSHLYLLWRMLLSHQGLARSQL